MTSPLSRRAGTAGLIAILLTAAVATTGGAAAVTTASTNADGNWWYESYGVPDAQAAGLTGKGVKITVIDAQIDPDQPVFDGADLTVLPESLCEGGSPVSAEQSEAAHGTLITALLVGNGTGSGAVRGIAPEASVTFIGYGHFEDGGSCPVAGAAKAEHLSAYGWGLRQAIDAGADIVTTSIGSIGTIADQAVVAEAIARGIVLVSSSPNNPGESFNPGSYRGVIGVAAMDEGGDLQMSSDFDEPVVVPGITVVAAGVEIATVGAAGDWNATALAGGSSAAAPLVAGMLALTAEKYPSATGSQLVQSLVRNTGLEDHPLSYNESDGFGYGRASLRHLLRVDPTQYPDENPLLDKGAGLDAEPTDEQLAAAIAEFAPPAASSSAAASPSAPATAPESDAAAAPAPDQSASPMGPMLTIGAIILVLLIAAAIIVIVILRRNRLHPQGSIK